MKTIRFAICVLLVLVCVDVQAVTIKVPYNIPTIQGGITVAALAGDEVVVARGEYFETINFLGKAVVVRSASGNPSDTIINGNGAGSVVTCSSAEGAGSVLSGFTITGGSSTNGGGMYNWLSSPTVTNCIFLENSALETGGGMFNGKDSAITNCVFIGNSALETGGGMSNLGSNPTVINCVFDSNIASFEGGGDV